MSLFPRLSLALVVALALTALVAPAAGASSSPDPAVQAARSCGFFRQGSVYVYKLRTRRASCRTARRVARAFNRCRHRNGASGRCRHRVRRFRCRENRGASSPAQYNSSVRCRRGGRIVRFGYTQNR
jgi:hypothetical protein